MAHVAQIRTREEAEHANWPCHWCEYGGICRIPIEETCKTCRKIYAGGKPTKFKIAETPR